MTIQRLNALPHRMRIFVLDKHIEQEIAADTLWIEQIDDIFIGRIMSCRYLRGMTWAQIGLMLHTTGDSCRMMVYRYLKELGLY